VTLPFPDVVPLGESAWTVVLGDRVDRAIHEWVLALAQAIGATVLPGIGDIVPGYATVTVFFTPSANPELLRVVLLELADATRTVRPPAAGPSGRPPVVIPTRYDGPDLEEVAARTGLTREDVIRRHAGREYEVYLLGFAPGFAYLGELDPALALPRRSSPRTRVPAGSVAIAGAQTAVYPLATPGGWHLIGRTDLRLFDPRRDPPALLAPGDRVRFEAVP
jgi:KipI family sensor histidine kinase inhibitor